MNRIDPKTQPKVCFYARTSREASYFVDHPNLLILKQIIKHYLSCEKTLVHSSHIVRLATTGKIRQYKYLHT